MSASELVLGTGPVRVGVESDPLRNAVGDALGGALGRKVRVVAAKTYGDLLARLAKGEVTLAWMSPALAVRAMDEHHAVALASSGRAAGANFYGVLFVRGTSKLKRAEELRGTRVAWVDRDSCSGYLFPRLALAKKELPLAGFFAEERFLSSHGTVARAVAAGNVDVGATYYNVAEDGWSGDSVSAGWAEATLDPMRVVLRTDPIPADLVIASASLPEAERDEVRAALLDLHATPAAAEAVAALLGAQRFDPVDLARYDVVREAMRG